VRLWWDPAVDIDVRQYELRYSTVLQDWEQATRIDRTDTLRYETTVIPEGTWRFHIKAIDSVLNYSSGTAAYVDIPVTFDTAAFSEYYDFTSYSEASNMVQYRLGRTDPINRWITEDGETFNNKFPSALNTYTNTLACYHTALPSRFTSEEWDIGYDIPGNFYGQMQTTCLAGGSVTEALLTKASGGSYITTINPMSLKTTARYVKLEGHAAATATLRVFQPTMRVRLTSVPRNETGFASTADDTFKEIKLGSQYVQAKNITVTPTGVSQPITPAIDNVTLDSEATNSFDVWLFNSSGSAIAAGFYWEFQGV